VKKFISKLFFLFNYHHLYRRLFFINRLRIYINSKKIEKKILTLVAAQTSCLDNRDIQSPDLISAFRINSKNRFNLLEETSKINFQKLTSPYSFYMYDGSPDEWIKKNRSIMNQFQKLTIHHEKKNSLSLPERYAYHFEKSKNDQFLMLFDDQPIINLSDELIKASGLFLKIFSSLVDLVVFGNICLKDIRPDTKKLVFSKKNSLLFKLRKNKVAEIDINGFKFGIYKNNTYGFIFNTAMGNSSRYKTALNWYIVHISKTNPQKIELSTFFKVKRGPVFEFIALSEDGFMVDLDFEPTDLSIRHNSREKNKKIFDSFKQNYSITIDEDDT
jgi:hypothetical protein